MAYVAGVSRRPLDDCEALYREMGKQVGHVVVLARLVTDGRIVLCVQVFIKPAEPEGVPTALSRLRFAMSAMATAVSQLTVAELSRYGLRVKIGSV
jgi:hypothetical protein